MLIDEIGVFNMKKSFLNSSIGINFFHFKRYFFVIFMYIFDLSFQANFSLCIKYTGRLEYEGQ